MLLSHFNYVVAVVVVVLNEKRRVDSNHKIHLYDITD